jgi:hypothetical protein
VVSAGGTTSVTAVNVQEVTSLLVTKTATLDDGPDDIPQAGETIDYTVTVANSGNVTLSGIEVTDPLVTLACAGGSNPIASLAPGESDSCSGSYTLLQSDVDAGQVINTATATGLAPDASEVNDSDTVTTLLTGQALLEVVKVGIHADANEDGAGQVGETIAYEVAVTNTGNLTVSSITVSDPLITLSCPSGADFSLAPNATETCTAAYELIQADIDAGQVENTATASGEDPDGNPVSASDTEVTRIMKAIFSDDFESGDTGIWSSRSP